mmetsp:Transcript_27849/g.83216  ORF Transcript_27849/g.83216 Transcript_27849/m.83216 type:complete len:232 (+) Transcript_27849:371-1066(+)
MVCDGHPAGRSERLLHAALGPAAGLRHGSVRLRCRESVHLRGAALLPRAATGVCAVECLHHGHGKRRHGRVRAVRCRRGVLGPGQEGRGGVAGRERGCHLVADRALWCLHSVHLRGRRRHPGGLRDLLPGHGGPVGPGCDGGGLAAPAAGGRGSRRGGTARGSPVPDPAAPGGGLGHPHAGGRAVCDDRPDVRGATPDGGSPAGDAHRGLPRQQLRRPPRHLHVCTRVPHR